MPDDAPFPTRPSAKPVPQDRDALLDELGDLTLPLIWSLSQAAHRALDPLGFRPVKALVLGLIVSGVRFPKDLSEMLDTAPPTVSALVADLEEQGHIARRADPADRRRVVLEATEAGHDMAARFREAWHDANGRTLAALRDEDLRHLLRITRLVTEPS